jgi:hypothetical protein
MQNRRDKTRYSLRLMVRYDSGEHHGTGLTVDLSSKSARVELDHHLAVGTAVRLFVNWPARLAGKLPLQLRVKGRVIKTDQRGAVVLFESHEFVVATRANDPGQVDRTAQKVSPQPAV